VTLGSPDADDANSLTDVSNFLAARNGEVWLVDAPTPKLRELKRFDARGRVIGVVARRGQGPGEFEAAGGLTQLPDGRVLLWDVMLNRITIFKETGGLDTTWTLPNRYQAPIGGSNILADTAGIVWLRTTVRVVLQESATSAATERPAWIRHRSNGTVLDTVMVPELPSMAGSLSRAAVFRYTTASGSTHILRLRPPFAPDPRVALSPLGTIVTLLGDQYSVNVMTSARGARERWMWRSAVVSIRRALPPVAIGSAERAELEAGLRYQIAGLEGTLSGSMPRVPATKAPITWLSFAEDGRMIVQVATASTQGAAVRAAAEPGRPLPPASSWREERKLYDVYERDGTFLGQFDTPPDVFLKAARGNTVWLSGKDEDGVPVIRSYQLTWRASGRE
jgi:hypothetical protein